MKAKEKAKELVDKYWNKLYEIQSRIIPTELTEQSKKCALICVDEIIESECNYFPNEIDYWQEVIEEINKL